MKLSPDVRAELRLFAFYLANRSLNLEILPVGIDYAELFRDASAVEQVFALWANVVELDENGKVTNAEVASRRAAQYVRAFVDTTYSVEPPFQDWELELHL